MVIDKVIDIINRVCKKSFTKATRNCFVFVVPKKKKQKIKDNGKVIKKR